MWFLIQKEFKQIFRNAFLPKLIFAFPIAVILIIPWAANMEIKGVNLAVLDWDKTTTSKNLLASIEGSSYFDTTLYALSLEEAHACISSGECDIILEIPNGLEKDLQKESSANVGIYANAINSTKGALGSGYLANIIMSAGLGKDSAISASSSASGASNAFGAFGAQILTTYRFNPNLNYKIYMIPALMVMVLTLVCGFLPAFNIVGEKERGNIEQINVTPISKFSFILSKLIPYWLIGFFILCLCFLLAFLVYGLTPRGSFGLIFTFGSAYVLVVAGLGLVISNYSNTMQQAMFVCWFFMLILILMSGLFTSTKSMPQWAQILSALNPLKYFIESLRLIFLKGSDFNALWLNFAILCAFAALFNLWAIMSYKKRS
ncbi:ABC transporter permease [Helicobacter sp. CLO-3]|uniref:ABC transporter permease n=1 Tax=unclassified Helicobacter TaxID=2593540 RepID=UPI000805FD19|nr:MULTISPECIES: ABC transporter permease [unclassified Helicobacter]OBV29892.1 ABC transporter permease [Helicobacter sp. CLO-3]OHU83696.1 ABC transporter permease [Helicobacter sp. CLO-3]